MENRLAEIESIIRYDVLRKSGPWAKRFEAVEKAVQSLSNKIATKEEIERALRGQTRELRKDKDAMFTRNEKVVAIGVSLVLIVLNIAQVFIPH